VDVVAVVAARERIRAQGAVWIEAVDQLARAQRSAESRDRHRETTAGTGSRAAAGFAVDRSDIYGAAERVVRDEARAREVRVVGAKRRDNKFVPMPEPHEQGDDTRVESAGCQINTLET
jgi:hypothetical protein